MRALHCLGAYRLMMAFSDDWEAAQKHTQKVKGVPLFVGAAEWKRAKAEAADNIKNHLAMNQQ